MLLGSVMGMLAGLRGGRLGAFIMRCADTMMCFPAEIPAILILVVLGQGVDKMLITIGLVMTPRFARHTAARWLREREFIIALGAGTLYVLRRVGELLVMQPPPSASRPTSASSAWAFRRRPPHGATWSARALNKTKREALELAVDMLRAVGIPDPEHRGRVTRLSARRQGALKLQG